LHYLITKFDVGKARALLSVCPQALEITWGEKKIHAIHLLAELAQDFFCGPTNLDDVDWGMGEDKEKRIVERNPRTSEEEFYEFIALFLEKNPEVFCQQDADGNNAFHYFCEKYVKGPFGPYNETHEFEMTVDDLKAPHQSQSVRAQAR